MPQLQVAVLDELDQRGIDSVALTEDDGRTAFLIDRYCDVVQRGVQCVHLGIADLFHFRLFVDARSETQFLRVGPAEIQDAGEDAHDLAFRGAKRTRERVAVEAERIDSRTGKNVGLSDLDRPVLERLREHRRNSYAISHNDVPLS